jgi:hypothetical protein
MLPDWDPATPLDIAITAELDMGSIQQECGLTTADTLRLAIVWHSAGTGLRGRGDIYDIQGIADTIRVELGLSIAGALLADRIRVSTQLVLANEPSLRQSNIVARHPGSLLWSEERTVILEGKDSRFPTELITFADSSWLPERAAWFLDWEPDDLHLPVLGHVRLFINADHSSVSRAVTQALPEDEDIRSAIRFDVGRTLILTALADDDFVGSYKKYDDSSIGAAIRRLLQGLFPFETIESLAMKRRTQASRFECLLQARLDLFHP